MRLLLSILLLSLGLAATAEAAPTPPAAAASAPQAVSASARCIYDRSRTQLLQIRTLLKTQDSQASVGSGFLVGAGTASSPTITW